MKADGVTTDKFLLSLGGKTIIRHITERLLKQQVQLFISINRNIDHIDLNELASIADPDFLPDCPLSGIWAFMDACSHYDHIMTVSSDTPFLPQDLCSRLTEAQKETRADIVIVQSNDKIHPTIALWSTRIKDDLYAYLKDGKSRNMLGFIERHRISILPFPSQNLTRELTLDPFFNINNKADYHLAKILFEKMAL